MIAIFLTGLVALVELVALTLQMFLWDTPRGRKAFGSSPEFARQSKVLAANQGLYNGFLAVGLLYGLALGADGTRFTVFFLGCVLVAGIFGAATSHIKILFIQAIPAGLALLAVIAGV